MKGMAYLMHRIHVHLQREREGGGGGEGAIKTLLLHLAICQGITLFVRNFLLNTWISGIKEEERSSDSFMHSKFSEKNFLLNSMVMRFPLFLKLKHLQFA